MEQTGAWMVFLAKNPNFRKELFGPDPVWPKDYEMVAIVEADSPDRVFAIANEPEFNDTEPPTRSFSVGDILLGPDGLLYLCEDVGWSHL